MCHECMAYSKLALNILNYQNAKLFFNSQSDNFYRCNYSKKENGDHFEINMREAVW